MGGMFAGYLKPRKARKLRIKCHPDLNQLCLGLHQEYTVTYYLQILS